MAHGKGVHHEAVNVVGQLAGEYAVVLLLAGVEPEVLQENYVPSGHLGHGVGNHRAGDLRHTLYRAAQEHGQPVAHRGQA